MMSPASTAGGRRRSTLAGLALAAAGALLTSACTFLPLPGLPAAAPTTQTPSQTAQARSTETATAVWEKPLDAIGQPVVQDGVALVYAKASGGVEAHAFSVADGKELWTQPVHPGLDAPGSPLEPALTRTAAGRTAAVFLQAATPPADNGGTVWWTAPVAFDLKTGKQLFRGRAELVTTRPYACDDFQDMCFIALDDTSKTIEHWIDLESGQDTAGPEINPLAGNFRPVGKELYSVVSGGVESLAHVSFGEVLWEIDIETIFGKGATSDLGWFFTYSEKLDLYVGSVGHNPTNDAADKMWEKTFSLDLRSNNKTAGFRASTGKVLWTAEGAHVMCAKGVGTSATKLAGGEAYPVRCEYTEGYREFPSGNYRGAKARVVGYEPLTGKAKWETEPVDVGWNTRELIPSATRGDVVIAGVPRSQNILDTRTGKFRPTSFEDVFVCLRDTTYKVPPNGPYQEMRGGGDLAAGSNVAFPCTKGGTPVPVLTYGALTDVDTTDNGTAVISLEGKVAGYRLLNDFT